MTYQIPQQYRPTRPQKPVHMQYKAPNGVHGHSWFVGGLPVPSDDPVDDSNHKRCHWLTNDSYGPVYICKGPLKP